MKTLDCGFYDDLIRNVRVKVEEEVTHSSDISLDDSLLRCGIDVVNNCHVLKLSSMGHKDQYRQLLQKTTPQDSRSQSLPDCSHENDHANDNLDIIDNCDIKQKLLQEHDNPASNELWFKTWPERCDKVKSNETSPSNSPNINKVNKSPICKDCDTENIKNGLSFNEALQNISLAYSPITKQLHLVESTVNEDDDDDDNNIDISKSLETSNVYNYAPKKLGHRRIEAGSYSSTVSSLSDPSPSGSLLDPEERSLQSFDDGNRKSRKKVFSNFFSRNVFTWKSTDVQSSVGNVLKLFGRSSTENSSSPQHDIISSSALIQHARPSTLPAKTLEEEQRHREEYKAILVAAKKKEAINTAAKQKMQKQQLKQEEQQANATKHFIQHVLPHWDTMKASKKTMDLWWQGLPSSIRGKVWCLAIGNDLNLTQQLYEICLSRAQARLCSPGTSQCELDNVDDHEHSMDVIQLDISRTFPHLCIFQDGGPYSDVLHSILAAYVCYRPDVGYVQGMSYIAAILILNMEQYEAFICFANLLNQPLHLSAFSLNQRQMQAYYDAYNKVFEYNMPKLYAHFDCSGLTPDLYLLDWIYTIFSKAVPLDVACRIWDVFLRDGYEFIFRTALGILYLHQDLLFEMDFLHGAQFLTRLPDDISSEQLFKGIQTVSTNIGKQNFSEIVDICTSLISSKTFS